MSAARSGEVDPRKPWATLELIEASIGGWNGIRPGADWSLANKEAIAESRAEYDLAHLEHDTR